MRKSLPLVAVVAATFLSGCTVDPSTAPPDTIAAPVSPALAPSTPAVTGPATLPPTVTGNGLGQAPPAAAPAHTPTRRPGPVPPSRRPTPPVEAVRAGWITATVTRGGSGPCFGFQATDGEAYAVYSSASLKLTAGERVRARITPGSTPVSCGTGRPARLEHVQLAG
ncbi:hypothetical protein ACQP2F_01520 [Actinoplanes sp. CA-030573]|uniref:hypothetical protein n=1 Tax=Actinoplanes sp. CA-030573 TaxID=3239898 RepID=UPI003D8B76E2